MSIWNELKEQEQQSGTIDVELSLEAWHCALVKGVGKVPYDPAAHAGLQKHIAITARAVMSDGTEIVRDMLSFDRSWRVMRESIARLGVEPQHFETARRARIRFAPVLGADGKPETYTNKAGETKERTTIEVIALLDGGAPIPSGGASAATSASAANGQDADKPQDAIEKIAVTWLSTIVNQSHDYTLADPTSDAERKLAVQRLYDASQRLRERSAVAKIGDERWMALCRYVVDVMNPPF